MDIPHFPLDSPEHTTNVPLALKGNQGKDNFEDLLLQSAERMKDRLTMGRYGVTAIRRSANDIMCIPSKPDFDGTFMGGAQFNVEAKVESGASFSLGEESFKESQYNWMRNKAFYGVPCFLVIHYNARSGKTFDDPAFTVSIHVHPDLQIWRDYEEKTLKRIDRELALQVGVRIPWTTPGKTKKPLPHFI